MYWGRHESTGKDHPAFQPDKIVEKVIIDYARVGGAPLKDIIERAKKTVREEKQ